jgi:hypothetical protein
LNAGAVGFDLRGFLMKRLFVAVAALALLPVFAPARADALTLGQRVSRLEAKMSCLRKVPLIEFGDYAWYGNPDTGSNAANVYAELEGNPDSLTDLGAVFGVDLKYGYPPGTATDVWALGIVNSSTCRGRFGTLANPFAARSAERRTRIAKLARLRQ